MKKLISTLRALYPLSDACIERIVSMVSVRRLARGEFLLSGEVGRDCLYFIESGSVVCFARYSNGESSVKWKMRKPRFISTLLPPAEGAEIICCVSECEVVCITASQVGELEAEFPELLQVYGMMIARMQRLEAVKQSRFLNSVVERGYGISGGG